MRFWVKEKYIYPARTNKQERINPAIFQISLEKVASIHAVKAPRRARSAYERIHPKPDAHPGLVPLHGISLSVPISAPRAVARRNPKNID